MNHVLRVANVRPSNRVLADRALVGYEETATMDDRDEAYRPDETDVREGTSTPVAARTYERPQVFMIGSVRELTRGSSASGSADANSQYYW
jgi:hypothetical protein